jgi:GAF domain-containing protein
VGEHEELAFLSDLVFSEETLESILHSLVALTTTEVVGADGATISLIDGDTFRTSVSTSEVHRAVDVIQYEVKEGPCLSAMTDGSVVLADFEDLHSRWPRFVPKAVAKGVYHSISAPLATHGHMLGSLNVYSNSKQNSFDVESAHLIEMLAGWVASMLRNFELYSKRGDLVQQLYAAMESRSSIDIAKGVLMERHQMNSEEAFAFLRAESQERNIKIREIAQELAPSK